MCFHFSDATLLDWLKQQVRVMEGWREEMAMNPDLDIAAVQRLEAHYQWLTSEITRLEPASATKSAA